MSYRREILNLVAGFPDRLGFTICFKTIFIDVLEEVLAGKSIFRICGCVLLTEETPPIVAEDEAFKTSTVAEAVSWLPNRTAVKSYSAGNVIATLPLTCTMFGTSKVNAREPLSPALTRDVAATWAFVTPPMLMVAPLTEAICTGAKSKSAATTTDCLYAGKPGAMRVLIFVNVTVQAVFLTKLAV